MPLLDERNELHPSAPRNVIASAEHRELDDELREFRAATLTADEQLSARANQPKIVLALSSPRHKRIHNGRSRGISQPESASA